MRPKTPARIASVTLILHNDCWKSASCLRRSSGIGVAFGDEEGGEVSGIAEMGGKTGFRIFVRLADKWWSCQREIMVSFYLKRHRCWFFFGFFSWRQTRVIGKDALTISKQ